MLTFKEDANLPGKFRAFKNRSETGLFIEANSASEAEDKAIHLLIEGEHEAVTLAQAVRELSEGNIALKAELAALKEEKGYAQLAAGAPVKKKSLFKRRRR